jgi:hypothetical protein
MCEATALIRKCLCCQKSGCVVGSVYTWCDNCGYKECIVTENNIPFDITTGVCKQCYEKIKEMRNGKDTDRL